MSLVFCSKKHISNCFCKSLKLLEEFLYSRTIVLIESSFKVSPVSEVEIIFLCEENNVYGGNMIAIKECVYTKFIFTICIPILVCISFPFLVYWKQRSLLHLDFLKDSFGKVSRYCLSCTDQSWCLVSKAIKSGCTELCWFVY